MNSWQCRRACRQPLVPAAAAAAAALVPPPAALLPVLNQPASILTIKGLMICDLLLPPDQLSCTPSTSPLSTAAAGPLPRRAACSAPLLAPPSTLSTKSGVGSN